MSADGIPDLLSFKLPEQVSISSKKGNFFFEKLAALNLRNGISAKDNFHKKYINIVVNIFSSMLFSIRYSTPIKLVNAIGLGHFSHRVSDSNKLLLGYFQSFKWASIPTTKEKLMQLKLKEYTGVISEYLQLSRIEEPLIVHVRLGDYINEKTFGVPSLNYYANAINRMTEGYDIKKIWLFSDEPEKAKGFIPTKYWDKLRVIPEIEGSAAKTLEIMRFGKYYIIGNSTFSWWGAFLSYTPNTRVIAPTPWFMNSKSPIDLIPTEWEVIKAW